MYTMSRLKVAALKSSWIQRRVAAMKSLVWSYETKFCTRYDFSVELRI